MRTVEDQIHSRIEAFVEELTALVRAAALEAVAGALSQGRSVAAPAPAVAAARPRGRPRKSKAPAAAAPASKAAPRSRFAVRNKGEKRPPALLAETVRRLGQYIAENPGQNIEQIGKALQTPTKDLSLPIKKLLREKKITSEGLKRATRYFPGA
jgi:hypothetical protein